MENNTTPMIRRELRRSSTQQWFGGVLSGVAETYGWNVTLLRVLFICSIFLPGPQVIAYLAAWLIMPR
ncbi:PspC domain-containing protein [Corynebacterium felinum]|uniref:Phage shock protein PspC (Stress-responsive transcriptional regulator) n=1 Tax=Corynebacterium felinum TaxID=131318 RepID=A0ABU2BBE0_9CORY|nr:MULTISPECIES: PspC domain-containing protein [Corynebacterium]MDF5821883.1 PspC domain-containing protein [Corynebacterium felinum]MDO4762446.1 PspC domain-containing protein [Corynebacterium sp.]MDR7355304.1 phage shock protein PspC (stress-responsive transcriptional regulator) [Corynebacterium felinum]WJY94657.1 PspC domain protein [Corynebacterium felinum]